MTLCKKERTRVRILEAAGKLFRQHGYGGTSVEEIMRQAGLTVGGFYAHFSSKADLFSHALEHTALASRRVLERGLKGKEGMERVRALVTRYLSREHLEAVSQGCLLPPLLGDASRAAEDAHRALEKATRRRYLYLMPHLAAAVPEEKMEGTALALLALCAGGISLARSMHSIEMQDQILQACREAAFSLLEKDAISA